MRHYFTFSKIYAMKKSILLPLLLLAFVNGFSQAARDQYPFRFNSVVKQERLQEVQMMSDFLPAYPPEWNELIECVQTEVLAICEGITVNSENTSNLLSPDQKNALLRADLGTDLRVKISFKYKDPSKDSCGSYRKIKEMEFVVRVVPETEAEFPGGPRQMYQYLEENILLKITEKSATGQLPRLSVTFSVNEVGKVVNIKLLRTSAEPETNKLLLEAFENMPAWKPAKNAKGIPVKEEFQMELPFTRGC